MTIISILVLCITYILTYKNNYFLSWKKKNTMCTNMYSSNDRLVFKRASIKNILEILF